MGYTLPFEYPKSYAVIPDQPAYIKQITITNEFVCTDAEEYKTEMKVSGEGSGLSWNNYDIFIEMNSITVAEPSSSGRYAIVIIDEPHDPPYYEGQDYWNDFWLTGDIRTGTQEGYIYLNYNYRSDPDYPWTPTVNNTLYPDLSGDSLAFDLTFSTNVPIFEYKNLDMAQQYISALTDAEAIAILKKFAINYIGDEIPDGQNITLVNTYTRGTWTISGQEMNVTIPYSIRAMRARILGDTKFCLYKIPGIKDGCLKYGYKIRGALIGIQTSTDGETWEDQTEIPWDFFYRPHEKEYGTFYYATSRCYTNFVPYFDDEDMADDYLDDLIDETSASNWNDISTNHPITVPTGEEADGTTFGDVYTKGYFSQQYILNDAAIQDISNALFDTTPDGIWDDIKKGVEMFGANPIDAVMGLSWWPFALDTVFTNTSIQNYIYFGGYQHTLTASGASCKKIVFASGHKDIVSGELISGAFKNWRDFEPYSKLYIVLPYIGTYQIDLARYLGKRLTVRYFFDTRTNSVAAGLLIPGDNGYILQDYFQGQMGVTMPITLTDYSAYANAQIQTLLGNGGQAAQSFGAAAGRAETAIAGGASIGAGLAAAAPLAAVAGAAVGAKTVYGVSQNNINNFNKTKGGCTSMINCYLAQRVMLVYEIQDSAAPENYNEMFGAPSMKAGNIRDFSGFLKCQSLKLNCPGATEREKETLKSLLMNGVYFNK